MAVSITEVPSRVHFGARAHFNSRKSSGRSGFSWGGAPVELDLGVPWAPILLPMSTSPTVNAGASSEDLRHVDRAQAGFSMIEVLIFSTILIMGLMALTSTAMTVDRLRKSNEEQRVAANALDTIMTEIRRSARQAQLGGQVWGQVVADAYAPGGTPGDVLPVRGLEPREGAAGVLRVDVITDETLSDQELFVELGLPVDLDGDGAIDSPDVTEDALVLPVVVTLEWNGSAGDASLRQGFFVTSY